MSPLIQFGVYLARVRFVETNDFKFRPVIVMTKPVGEHSIVTVVPVFSSGAAEASDVTLVSWQQTGLRKPSVARIHRLSAIAQLDLLEELGSLRAKDVKLVKPALKKHLEL